jgi:hypothetical protein
VDAQTGEEMRDVYEKAYVINKKIFVKKAWLYPQFVA